MPRSNERNSCLLSKDMIELTTHECGEINSNISSFSTWEKFKKLNKNFQNEKFAACNSTDHTPGCYMASINLKESGKIIFLRPFVQIQMSVNALAQCMSTHFTKWLKALSLFEYSNLCTWGCQTCKLNIDYTFLQRDDIEECQNKMAYPLLLFWKI